jgi:hypothetical protein
LNERFDLYIKCVFLAVGLAAETMSYIISILLLFFIAIPKGHVYLMG